MKRWRGLLGLALVVAGVGFGLVGYLTGRQPGPAPGRGTAVSAVLGRPGPDSGDYAQVLAPRPFVFPADYGPHPRYRNEWWYFTGNLATATGRRFGFELTLFRIALAPAPPDSLSHWATNQLYMAHFAVTDVAGRRFHDAQRLTRGALGLAGARATPFRVWVNDWGVQAHGPGAAFPWQLHARTDAMAVMLELSALTAVVAQGDQGFSRKSAGRGHASYYYSIPRLAARGSVEVHGQRFTVTGLVWLDREWSSGALAADQTGWDWFALQFDDGTDLMFYRLRDRGDHTDPYSAGSLITPAGGRANLTAGDVRLRPQRWWTSPDGARYPVAWRLALPARDCVWRVEPLLDDQELRTLVRYWEGAVAVSGHCRGRSMHGHGYLELTGYAPGANAGGG